MARGAWKNLGSSWSNTRAAVTLGDRIYAATSEALYAIDADGAYQPVDDEIWRAQALTAVGDRLIMLSTTGTLYQVTVPGGERQAEGGSWEDAVALAASAGAVYVVERSGGIFRVVPGEAGFEALDNHRFGAPRQLCAAGGALVVFDEDGDVHRVDVGDGSHQTLATSWPRVSAAVGAGAKVYVCDGGTLYELDPGAGTHAELVTEPSRDATTLAVLAGRLFVFERGGDLIRIDL